MSNIDLPDVTFSEIIKWIEAKKEGKNPLLDEEWEFLELANLKFNKAERRKILKLIYYKINPRQIKSLEI